MVEESFKVIIDDELSLNVDTGIIGYNVIKNDNVNIFPIDDINDSIDRIEKSITDIESSLNPNTISRLSNMGREKVYLNAGFITNIILGIFIGLLVIILLI